MQSSGMRLQREQRQGQGQEYAEVGSVAGEWKREGAGRVGRANPWAIILHLRHPRSQSQ